MKTKLFFKKMLAILSSVLILLSLMVVPAAADTTNLITVPEEVATESMNLLSGLGLAEPAVKFDNAVSRGDFAQLLANMMRYDNFGAPDSGYRDLTGNIDAINFCVEQGYMSGDKGLFRPTDAITYAEAAKALVEMTGVNYAKIISTTASYMSKASSLGISRGITGGANDPLSVGAAFKMLANTLKADSIKTSAVSVDGYISDITRGRFMENMLHIEKVTGVLTRTQYTGIYTAEGLGSKQVEIDDVIYKVNKDWTDFLGCNVEAYVDCHDETPVLRYMAVSDVNETLELTAEDIVSLDGSYVLTYYEDEEEEDTKAINLARETTVIYNGRNAGSIVNFTNNELKLKTEDGKDKTGSVRLLDSDGDGTCDVIIMTVYETMHVSMADINQMTIMDKNITTPLDLSMMREEDIHVSYEGGTEGDFSVIAADQVLSVAKSRDNKLVNIIISENSLDEIVVSGVRDNEYLIDGVWYKTNPYYDTYYASRQDDGMRIGWAGSIKLDLDGRITAPANATNLVYGYLIAISDPIGLDSNIQVKIFTEEGGHEILDLASKVSVNHAPYKEENVKALAVFKNGTAFRDQLVRFSTNDKGEVNGVITADRSDIKTTVDGYTVANTSWYNDGHKEFMLNYEGSLRYKHGGLFSNKYRYSGKLWIIPNDLTNEKGFVVSTVSQQLSNDSTYTLQLYNVNEYGVPEVMIRRTDAVSTTFARDNRLFVSEIIKAINADGEVVYKITGARRNTTGAAYMQTSTITTESLAVVDTELTFDAGTFSTFAGTPDTDGIEPGDVIRYQNDTMGVTTKIVTEFDYSSMLGLYGTTRDTDFTTITDPGSERWLIHGQVVYGNKSCVALTVDGGTFFRTFMKSSTDQWIVWNPKEKTYTLEVEPALHGALQQGGVTSQTSHIYSVLGYCSTGFTVVYLPE